MATAIINTQVWTSDCEGQLSHRLFIFHSNGTCGVPSHRYFMQKARIIHAFNFRSQDDWRSNWWRPTKEGNGVFFFFKFSSSFLFSQSFFPLGLAIIPRRTHLENYSSQIIFIMQPALLALYFQNGREFDAQHLLILYYVLLCMLMLNEIR